ncbi:glucose-1-phosphate adenylyltransferase [Treponema phagedenis]|uniref:Glucose-1-phosphate adenylyltransferase n=1 Tax=Treponema phagedenis TaxID=162 RepID=A0A0B7GXW4_TREPH|nr:glucose-1-phosphate adenylyltransferase [Treponema phagedenis]QSI00296.1 glucose-1-phosphate adenylyltransferase [Treponema phagedenis]CEM63358.1 Glucose-1-phosphate adenylyltransferase [Treponema phagedenis]
MSKVLSIILGGGKGTRLYPLTKERSKPAVPFGGKHRIVDIPISNCINSGFRNIYLLTQFNSASLHLHIAKAYIFDSFSNGFVEILAAEQTFAHSGWYEGTADAVRKNFTHFKTQKPSHYLILSGDQLYRMNLKDFLQKHEESGSDITIACTPVNRSDASGFGIMQIDKNSRITSFMEKPGATKNIDEWKIPENSKLGSFGEKEYLASMGIYIFNTEAMEGSLANNMTDFGKEIIPMAIQKYKVSAYVHTGYWEDIGTIRSFYEATLDLTEIKPQFDFYDAVMPIYTHNRNLPPSKINAETLDNATCSEGCVITSATIKHSVIGIRSIIESGSILEGVVCMGADYYETEAEKEEKRKKGTPCIGIGSNCRIKKAIIDKNACIGNNVSIGMGEVPPDGDYDYYHIVDRIYVITKNAIIPDGTII